MSFLSGLKKISIKKITATVKKTIGDATHIATAVSTGGIAGGLSAVGSLSKNPNTALTPTTVYGPPAANGGGTAAATAPGGSSDSNMPLLIGAGLLLVLLFMAKR